MMPDNRLEPLPARQRMIKTRSQLMPLLTQARSVAMAVAKAAAAKTGVGPRKEAVEAEE